MGKIKKEGKNVYMSMIKSNNAQIKLCSSQLKNPIHKDEVKDVDMLHLVLLGMLRVKKLAIKFENSKFVEKNKEGFTDFPNMKLLEPIDRFPDKMC